MSSNGRSERSPYIENPKRLADVIAAIQATATYKFYQLGFDGKQGWPYRIDGDSKRSKSVRQVFVEHPEFFRIDSSGKGALVWRRQHRKLYHVDRGEEISKEAYGSLSDSEKARISRAPLGPEQIQTLISAATELHQAALEQERSRRWWVSPLTAIGGALAGGLVSLLSVILGS